MSTGRLVRRSWHSCLHRSGIGIFYRCAVILQGILTLAEVSLAAVQAPEKGRDMLKSVRTYLLEVSRTRIDALIAEATDSMCVSMHHDISTVTGEEVFVFTLSKEIELREPKRI